MNKPGAPKNNQNAAKPADKKSSSFLYIRCLPHEKAAWVKAANARGLKLSQFVTEILNTASEQIKDQ